MNKPGYCTVFFVFVLLIFALSCRKHGSSAPPNQKIQTIDYGNQQTLLTHYRIMYDLYSRVDSIIGTDFTNSDHHFFSKFFYDGSGVTVVKQDNYTIHTYLNSTDTLFIQKNTDGRIVEIYSTDTVDTLFMDYNYFMVTRLRYDSVAGAPFNVYSWDKGGNLDTVKDQNGQPTEMYTYNLAKSSTNVDGIRITQFLNFGDAYVQPRNLVTRCMYSATNYADYKYTYDNAGRMTQLKIFTTKIDSNVSVVDTVYYNYTY
jgi:hypothetical protein